MAPLTPPPETENPILEFTPGDLEPIDPPKDPKPFSMIRLSAAQGLLKNAFRPILFTALGLHGILLFVPLTSVTQVKPKETAEPVKIKRLSDKVLVKSMPKVKVTAATKPSLPKVAIASSNPIVVKPPDIKPEAPKEEKKVDEKKPDEKKPEEKKSDEKKTPDKTPDKGSDKGEDPSKVDPKKATTNKDEASQLDAESQKFADVIALLQTNSTENVKLDCEGKPEDMLGGLLENPSSICKNPPPQGITYVGGNPPIEDVITNLSGNFPDKFVKKAEYGGGLLYEAQIGKTTRYVSMIKGGTGIIVALWEKSPM